MFHVRNVYQIVGFYGTLICAVETNVHVYSSYNGRATAASPATGSKAAHNKELRNLLEEFCVL